MVKGVWPKKRWAGLQRDVPAAPAETLEGLEALWLAGTEWDLAWHLPNPSVPPCGRLWRPPGTALCIQSVAAAKDFCACVCEGSQVAGCLCRFLMLQEREEGWV